MSKFTANIVCSFCGKNNTMYTSILLCYQFWTNFWPNFTSTVFGLLLGLPIALWTNRIITNYQDKLKYRDRNQRLHNAIKIIRQTLVENDARLQTAISIINNNKVQFDIQLDISAWDAVKDDITGYLHDTNLKKKLAYHFSMLTTTAKLNTLYLDFSAGVASALGGNEKTRDNLKNYLLTTTASLSSEVAEILLLIDSHLLNK